MKKQIKKATIVAIFALLISFSGSAQCVQCDANSAANGTYSSVLGMSAVAEGQASLAAGLGVTAIGNYSIALGKYLTSGGVSSVTIGRYFETSGSGPIMIIGTGASLDHKLFNNHNNSLMIGLNSDKPTLFVQGAPGEGYTGKIGIGDVTDLQAKLHIKADAGETAEVFIEPSQWSGSNPAYLWLGTKQYGLKASYERLEFKTVGKYVFYEGNVGIGTYQPSEKLEVDGNIRTTGFMMTTGPVAGRLLQSDAAGNASWADPAWIISNESIYRMTGNIGIGTNNPSCKLHIVANVDNSWASVIANTHMAGKGLLVTGAHISYKKPILQLNDFYDDIMFVALSDGNVGIGTSTPTQKFEVNGIIKANGLLLTPNSAYGRLLQSDAAGNATWTDPAWSKSGGDVYKLTGNVGVGTQEPLVSLDLSRNIQSSGKVGIRIVNYPVFPWFIGMNHDDYEGNVFVIADYNQMSNGAPFLAIKTDGSMGIGTTGMTPGYRLNVKGKILAEEVKIIENVPSSDYVFDPGYPIIPLERLEEFIFINKHLPEVPTAEEFRTNGYEVGTMDDLLLRKIEELTLYIIDQQKEIETLKMDLRIFKTAGQ